MSNLDNIDFSGHFSEWQGVSSFNTYWQYSYVNRSAYYANIRGEYYEYMYRWVQNYLWWYDGWVPYFHNNSQGIFSTKIASAIVNGAAKKVVGGRIFFKTKNKEKNLKKDTTGGYKINETLSFINDWSVKQNFGREIKKAVAFAAAAGTSLLKIDKQAKDLSVKALRFDSFYPTVGFNGKIIDLICFIKDFTQLNRNGDKSNFSNFYVVEHRFYGDYQRLDGTIENHVPLVKYEIKRTTGTITTGQEYDTRGETIEFDSLPKNIKREISKSFNGINFKQPIRLPFSDNMGLGAELINWTDCVSAIPELPFGESLLYNIMPYLQSYDYYWSAFNTDMYLGRGRILLPKQMQSNNAKGRNSDYNTGLDSMMFTQVEMNSNGEEIKPTPIQFDLRSQSWQEIRTMIIQNISINTGLNLATIASFLNDTNAARTAREISTEESETALFVDDKREIIERPINRIIKIITLYYGYMDDVVIRWSAAGLSNIYARADMISQGVTNGFISKKKAIQMFNQDDDEYQLQEEYDNIESDSSAIENNDIYGGTNDSEQAVEYPSAEDRGSGNANSIDGKERISEQNFEKQN